MKNQAHEHWLSTQKVVALLGVNKSTIKRRIDMGMYVAQKVDLDKRGTYLISLSSLPPDKQEKYLVALAQEELKPLESKIEVNPYSQLEDIKSQLWQAWEQAPAKAKTKAKNAVQALFLFQELIASSSSKADIADVIRHTHGISSPTLWRYLKIVNGYDKSIWAPLLLPKWKGRTAEAEFTPEAWEFIKQSWGSQSQPTISYVIRQAIKLAPERGWIIPSHDTVERRIRDLPPWWVVLRRQGEKALANLYPSQQRDYSTLKLHEIWCADGHKADVFCRWDDGTISRPIIVAWIDLRSRVCLGYAVGKVESADLVRQAFKNAATASKAIPEAALVDNGRGFASKLLTGGTPNRYRFKVKEEDIPGILTVLGIQVTWATPGHGQAKPIESWWRTLAQMAKRSEFRGAYCGNRPDAKPEEFNPKVVAPLETYLRLLKEEISDYHQRAHRGDSMYGKSPRQIYDSLLPNTILRQPTAEQLRLCLLAAQSIRLNPEHQIVLLDNRYWTERLSELRRDRDYVVRFNPEDASEPIALYEGERFICEVPIIQRTGFRDQQAAKDQTRARNKFVRAIKEQDQAKREMSVARDWKQHQPNDETILPQSKIASLVHTKLINKMVNKTEEETVVTDAQYKEIMRQHVRR